MIKQSPLSTSRLYNGIDIETLKDADKGHLFALIDAYLKDAKTRLAYGS